MNRKLWTIGLALLLLCSILPPSLFAAEEPEFYIAASKTELAVGDAVEVEIGVRHAKDMVAFELNLTFDSTFWLAGNDAFSTKLNGFSAVVNPELLAGGHVRAVYTKLGQAAGETGNIVLGKVKLTAKAVGTGTFTLNSVKVGDVGDQWTNYTPGIQANARVVSSGSSGSGGGGTDTPSGYEPIITDTLVLIKQPASVNGTVQAKLNDTLMQKAVGLLNGSTLRIQVQPGSADGKVELEFPLAQLRGNEGRKVLDIVVDSGLAVVTLDRKLIESGAAAFASNLKVIVSQLDASALPTQIGAQVQPGAAVYDFELLLDGQPVGKFDAGEVTVEVPYSLRPGETADKIVIYYVSESGELELVKNARYNPATGTVKFSPKHFSKYFPAYVHKTFGDLDEAEWARAYIEALAAREAVNGVGNDAFRPNDQLTRAQFITMLVQLFDLKDASVSATFTDVKQDAWYYAAVASAQKLGIVAGKPDGSFGVNDAISRQDMAVMLYRASKALGLTWSASPTAPTFADADSIAPYAVEAVAVMQAQGILNGMSDNKFIPRGLSTRAQAATVLYKIFGL